MAWFRTVRRPRVDLGTFVPPDARPPASMEELLYEGELVSASAVRLAIKNRIITGSLRDDLGFDGERNARAVAEELLLLADERDSDADRIESDRLTAEVRRERARTFHDYTERDLEQLARREDYSRQLAERLRALAGDEAFARETAERAQEAAWDEIAASVKSRLTRAATIGDEPDYVIERLDRLRDLSRDLKELEKGVS